MCVCIKKKLYANVLLPFSQYSQFSSNIAFLLLLFSSLHLHNSFQHSHKQAYLHTHKYSCIKKCMQSTILFVYSLRRLLVVFLSYFLILFYCCYYCCHYSCSCCCYCFCFYYYSPLFCVYVNKHVEDEEKKYPRVSFSSFMIKITVTVYCCLCSCRLRSCFVYIQWQR